MTALLYLIPASILLALAALLGFVWTLRSGQYEDLQGDAARMLDTDDRPLDRQT